MFMRRGTGKETMMGKRLYVGGLPFEATEDQVKSHFGACGSVVSVKVITDRYTGRSRGFGFVEMGTDDEAQAAIQKLNGSEMGSRRITVSEARPMEERGERGGGGGGGGYGGRGGGGRGGGGRGGERRW
jgi:RNA recognition motif-containing protein